MAHFTRLLCANRLELQIEHATSWFSRFLGLMGRSGLPASQGLLLDPCGGIHTMWMRFSIDVIFLDESHRVLAIHEHVRPFRFCFAPKGTRKVLELASGNVKPTGIHLDQVLNFV